MIILALMRFIANYYIGGTTMEFKINGLKWNAFFVDKNDSKLLYDGSNNLGVTYYDDLKIYLKNDMSKPLFRQTVIHELVHAFLFSYGIHLENSDVTEEAVCDFCGAHLDKILKLTKRVVDIWER